MKKLLLLAWLLVASHLSFASEKPKVCLNMIIKNESHVITRCLESVKPLIDYWVIVDTGSTDGTQDIVREFMKDIPGELHERPWIHFEHNRNEALQLAESKAEYLLFIDADDIYTYDSDFVRPEFNRDAYSVKIRYGGLTYYRVQMIRANTGWKWVGAVHEVLVAPNMGDQAILDGVTMVIIGGGDRSNDPKKYQKDAALLETAVERNPFCTRSVFYLAQSYRDAGMLEESITNYEKRVRMGGWDQEVFVSLYQMGLIKESMGKSEDQIVQAYTDAFTFRPTRAEPLYRLSAYYRKHDNHLLSYLTAKHGLSLREPNDPLFVETWIYDFGLLFEFSISSYYVGKYEESYRACKKLLARPDLPPSIRECVERNIQYSIPKVPHLVNAAP
ncbi:MAG: glycosyltransferase [Chlamydiota bacterium]